MRMRMLLLLSLFIVVGCGNNSAEEQRQEAAKQAKQVASLSWALGVPIEKLVDAANPCHATDADCADLDEQLQAIADGLASCTNDSRLCQAVSTLRIDKRAAPLREILPKGRAFEMPTNPFYWRIGNLLLDSQATRFGYRAEVWESWRTRNRENILGAMIVMVIAVGGWIFQGMKKAEKVAESNRVTALRKKEEEDRTRIAATRQKAEEDARQKAIEAEEAEMAQKAAAEAAEENARKAIEAEEAEMVRKAATEAAEEKRRQMQSLLATAFKVKKR